LGAKVGKALAPVEETLMPEFDIIDSNLQPGLSVIEASAGTGKTHTLSHLVPRLILDGTVDSVSRIVLVTFTKDAARELSQRVRGVLEQLENPHPERETEDVQRLREKFPERLQDGVARRALLEIDLLRVSTIHSFCQQVLQTEGALCGLPVMPELLAEAGDIAEEEFHRYWETKVSDDPWVAAAASLKKQGFETARKFVQTNLANHKAEPLPALVDVAVIVSRLEALSSGFTAEACEEVAQIFGQVTHWKAGFNPPDITKMCARLQRGIVDIGNFTGAIAALDGLAEKINGNKHKALKASATACRAAQLAAEFKLPLKQLEWSMLASGLRHVHSAVQERLKRGRLITYDGLIVYLHEALVRGNNSDALKQRLCDRYRVALIDESQDTDRRQYEIFEKIFASSKHHRLLLIGDPKQAIYEFRGADVNTYLAARDNAGEIFGRNHTRRAHAPLVKAWNAIFARDCSLLKEGLHCPEAQSALEGDRKLVIAGKPQEARMEFWIAPDNTAALYAQKPARNSLIAAQTATKIVEVLQKGMLLRTDAEGRETSKVAVRPKDCAILVSDHFQAAAIEEALKERNVPSVRVGTEDVMASEEAAGLLEMLRALDDPRRKTLRFSALATRLLGRTDAQLRDLAESEDAVLEDFLRWSEVFTAQGPGPAIALIDREEEIVARLAAGDDGDRRITNFRQLADLLQNAYAEHGNHPGKFLRWFEGEVARASGRSQIEERQLLLESDAESVRIVTVHKAKGLQYPLVFCPFLWTARELQHPYHKLCRGGQPDALVDTGLEPSLKVPVYRNQLEQNLRLAYVAMTRAEVALWIHAGELSGPRKPSEASALDWLLRGEYLQAEDFPLSDDRFETWRTGAKTAGRGTRHENSLSNIAHADDATDVIAWCPPPEPTPDRWEGEETEVPIVAAAASPSVPGPWYLTSFSALTRESDPYGGVETSSGNSAAEETIDVPKTERNPFLAAAGGKAVGTAVHGWLEQWDFGAVDERATEAFFESFNIRKRKSASEGEPTFGKSVAGMLGILREALLPGFGCSVADACPEPAASEWKFYLPLHEDKPFDPVTISRVFAKFPQEGFEGYPARLADLQADALRGYLHGFIDRLAVDPKTGNWGVIDWKTNNLGRSPRDFDLTGLRECAMDNHYFLQMHLYLVAVRRHLAAAGGKVAAKDAWLVFPRGVARGTGQGILHLRPPDELLAALDELFSRP